MAYLREGIDAHVREYFDKRLQSTFIQRNPLLYFLGLRSAEGKTKLGQPKASAIFGGVNLGQAEVDEMLGSKEIYHTYQKNRPSDGTYVEFGGSTAVASSFAEDNAGQIAFRWTHHIEPLKIRKHSLDFAKGESAIGAIVERASNPVWIEFQRRFNGLLWDGGVGSGSYSTVNMNSSAQQNQEVWREPLGLRYTTTASNLYGRTDRSVETILNPMTIAAATAFSSSVVDLNINRAVNNGYVDASTSTAVDGLANKNPNGVGCDLFITTSALFNELALQSEGRAKIYHSGIPGHAVNGFQNPIIEHDNVYYTWDKDCPAGYMYGLCLDEWLMEVAAGKNFVFSGFVDKSKTEEGGGYYEWGNYQAAIRLSCRRPDLQVAISGLTVG